MTLTLHWVHKLASHDGRTYRTECGRTSVVNLEGAANAGHGGPCPACTNGITYDEWARRDRIAWTAYQDGIAPTYQETHQ